MLMSEGNSMSANVLITSYFFNMYVVFFNMILNFNYSSKVLKHFIAKQAFTYSFKNNICFYILLLLKYII